MAINGERFLRISKVGFFSIKDHALERIEKFTGKTMELEVAFDCFCRSTQLTYSEMWVRGYRPAYQQRKQAGVATWYFELSFPGCELIAVIARGDRFGEYEWITTYTQNHRNESNILWQIQEACVA